jgi:hypothetical protein
MKTFLSDLWNDLRAKRLWPVAVLLLAGLVAVPVLLSQSAEEPPAPTTAAGAARKAPEPKDLKGLATVKLEEGDVEDGSMLDTFDPSNPFRPPAKVVRGAQEAESGSASSSGPGSAETPSSGSGGSSGSTGSSGDTGSSGGSGTPGAGGGSPGGSDGGQTTTKTTEYAYVIDVTFRANGRTRKVRGMDRLDMLPSQASPLLLFLGVSSNAGNAVFLVDSTLDAAGEGRCKPSKADCAFLHLGAGSEHAFTDEDGDTYRLRVDEIRKVKLGRSSAAAASADTNKASAAAGAASPARRFASPLISDLVSVSTTAGGDSQSNRDRR